MPAQNIFRFLQLLLAFQIGWQYSSFGQSYDCEEELFSKKDKQTRLFGYVNAIGEYRIPPSFLKAMPFVGRNAVVQQGKRFGVINCEGILVVPADYEEIASFSNGKGWVKKGGLWGLADLKGRLLIAPQYEEVKEINVFSGTVTWVKKQGLWGLISKENGRMIINPQYEDVSGISDSAGLTRKNNTHDLVYYGDGRIIISGMKQIRKISRNLFAYQSPDKKWGAFNSLAFILIRPEWDDVKLNGFWVQVEKAGISGIRNLKGAEVTPVKFNQIQEMKEGYAAVKEGESWQILNTAATPILPGDGYDFAHVVSAGIAVVSKGKSYGIWNPSSKTWVLAPAYSMIRTSADCKWLELKTKDGLVAGFDCITGKFSAPQWDSLAISDPMSQIRGFSKGKVSITSVPSFEQSQFYYKVNLIGSGFATVNESGKSGVVRYRNEFILPLEFDMIRTFRTAAGMAFSAQKDGLKRMYGEKGQALTKTGYQEIRPCRNQIFIVETDGKWGLVNESGQWVLEARFDSVVSGVLIKDETDFPVVAYRKGKGALVNGSGSQLTDPMEGVWFSSGEGLWVLKNKSVCHLFNSTGKSMGDIVFDQFLPYSEGTMPVRSGGKWGYLNHSGRLVIPAKFDEALPTVNGLSYVKENNLWGILKKNGSWLVKPAGTSIETDPDGKRHLVIP